MYISNIVIVSVLFKKGKKRRTNKINKKTDVIDVQSTLIINQNGEYHNSMWLYLVVHSCTISICHNYYGYGLFTNTAGNFMVICYIYFHCHPFILDEVHSETLSTKLWKL